jgi:pyruvate kinase
MQQAHRTSPTASTIGPEPRTEVHDAFTTPAANGSIVTVLLSFTMEGPQTLDQPTRSLAARQLHAELTELREEVAREGAEAFAAWREHIERPQYLPSAENLAHYLALRRHDLRDVQLGLMPLGLSSLGRCEARVLPNLDAVLAALAAIGGVGEASDDAGDRESFFRGHELLQAETESVLGPTRPERAVRVMVTLATEAAHRPQIARELVAAGMDVARINCSHDDPDVWAAMAANVGKASSELGSPTRICFDLAGPRARIASTTVRLERRVRRSEALLMTSRPVPVESECPHQLECSLPEIVDALPVGAEVRVNEGRLGAIVERRLPEGLLLRVQAAREKGEHVRAERGLNFPDLELELSPLRAEDLACLDAVAAAADVLGLSFVQRPGDVRAVQEALAERGEGDTALMLKIETALGVRNLPELIVAGAGRQPLGIMIARGDLAVEIGHRRLAEIQEELLWLCEAAHVPVIWATQVLDNLVKKGVEHRGEMTDAAMAERAECVMLNKGPYAVDAVKLLVALLERMEGHQFKKTSRMRALQTWMTDT